MRKNIFVLGLEEFNLALLESMPRADEYAFLGLLDHQPRSDPEMRAQILEPARAAAGGA